MEVKSPIIEKYSPNNDPNDFFCLTVSDNAAEPKFCPGDTLIIKKCRMLGYDDRLLVVALNGDNLLRKVSYDDDEDIFILKDHYGIYPPVIVRNEDNFDILGYPVYLLRDLSPDFIEEKEGSLNDE